MSNDPRLDPHANPACRDVNPEIFFPPSGRVDIAATAKAICARCEIKEKCLAWALGSKQADGILGGLTKKERNAIKRAAAKEVALANRRDAAAAIADIDRRALLGDLLAERDGDSGNLWKEMVHPPMPIGAWAE